jgi:inosose dehydratase
MNANQIMNVSLGINPITWSNDDLQYIGGDISLQTCLEEASSAGYDGIELGHKFPRDAQILKPLLDKHQLALVSGWYSGGLLERDSQTELTMMNAHASLLEAMDCDLIIFAEVTGCIHSMSNTGLSLRPRLSASQWKTFGQRMSEVGKATSDRGLKLCFHHHMGTVVQSEDDIDALMNATTDDVYLLLDTGHAVFAGADPVQLARQYGDRIGHVHCKDIRPSVLDACLNRNSSFLDAVLDGAFTVPGDGCVDYAQLFNVLSDTSYEGWLVVEAEQDPSVAPPAKYANLGINNLNKLLAA